MHLYRFKLLNKISFFIGKSARLYSRNLGVRLLITKDISYNFKSKRQRWEHEKFINRYFKRGENYIGFRTIF